jgi:polyisoprenyl-phosphate glycosyltransferase
MNNSDVKISFVVPLFNEESVFALLITRLNQFSDLLTTPHEIILIDDGSTDKTPELMEALSLSNSKYHSIFLSRNFGHQYAVSAGLMFARGTEGVMILDGDLQDPPEVFASFYTCLMEGYDVVYGIRTKRKENGFKRISYYFFYRLLSKISSTPIFLDSGDFSLLSRRVVDIINKMPENSRFLRGMRGWIGFKQKGIVYERDKRAAGEPKYTLSSLFKLAYDGIFNFSFFPIKFLTWSGTFCITSSIIYLAVTVYKRIFENDVPTGFTALLFMIIFFGGIQLISIGIIGEYVFRTFQQVKNRPLFIVKSRIQKGEIVNE